MIKKQLKIKLFLKIKAITYIRVFNKNLYIKKNNKRHISSIKFKSYLLLKKEYYILIIIIIIKFYNLIK